MRVAWAIAAGQVGITMGLAEDYTTRDATALADLVRQRQVSPAVAEHVGVRFAILEQP
jgi:hypothetical protein